MIVVTFRVKVHLQIKVFVPQLHVEVEIVVDKV